MYIKFAPKVNAPPLPLVAIDAGYETILRSDPYDWPFYQLVCGCQGQGTVVIGEDSVDLMPGRVLLMKPGTVHEYVFRGAAYQLSWVSFNGYLADKLIEQYDIESPYVTLMEPAFPGIHLDILSLLEEVESYMVIDRVSVILYRMLIGFFMQYHAGPSSHEESNAMDRHLRRAIDWMEANLSSPVDVIRISQELGLSRQHLTRLIRKKFAMTSIEFLTKLKMLQAQKELIKLPVRSIREIAAGLGYTNASHFARVFREYSAYSPSDFRTLYLHRSKEPLS